MSDTPRTDAALLVLAEFSSESISVVPSNFARELERENNQLRAQIAELEPELLDEIEIENAARVACPTYRTEQNRDGLVGGSLATNSNAISVNAAALRRLAKAGRFRVVLDMGRVVIGYWPENDPMRKYSEGEPGRGRELPAGK